MPLIPRQCDVQRDVKDFHMFIVSLAFQPGLREWIKIPLPHSVAVSACRWCDEWVEVAYHDS
jgi:hypothetical protein